MSRIVEIVSCMSGYDPDALHVEKAREAMRACITPISATEQVPIRAALHRVLAQDIVPTINVPAHDNSAMDGYAVRFAEDKRSLERWGTARIARELHRRGVAPKHVEHALSAWGRQDELEAAIELLDRRMPLMPGEDRERDRAWRLLVRRGYEPELAYEAVRAHGRRAA